MLPPPDNLSRNARRRMTSFIKLHQSVARRNCDKLEDPDLVPYLVKLSTASLLQQAGKIAATELNTIEKETSRVTGIPLPDVRIISRFSQVLIETYQMDQAECVSPKGRKL